VRSVPAANTESGMRHAPQRGAWEQRDVHATGKLSHGAEQAGVAGEVEFFIVQRCQQETARVAAVGTIGQL